MDAQSVDHNESNMSYLPNDPIIRNRSPAHNNPAGESFSEIMMSKLLNNQSSSQKEKMRGSTSFSSLLRASMKCSNSKELPRNRSGNLMSTGMLNNLQSSRPTSSKLEEILEGPRNTNYDKRRVEFNLNT